VNSVDQEQLVALLTRKMAEAQEGAANVTVGSGPKNSVVGASGYGHHIDVSVDAPDELALYECKYWGGNVDPEAVLALAARGVDIQQAQTGRRVTLHMVVRRRLSSGAQLLAIHFGIVQHVVESAAEFAIGYKANRQVAAAEAFTMHDTGDKTEDSESGAA
jgi:hypothetical protein